MPRIKQEIIIPLTETLLPQWHKAETFGFDRWLFRNERYCVVNVTYRRPPNPKGEFPENTGVHLHCSTPMFFIFSDVERSVTSEYKFKVTRHGRSLTTWRGGVAGTIIGLDENWVLLTLPELATLYDACEYTASRNPYERGLSETKLTHELQEEVNELREEIADLEESNSWLRRDLSYVRDHLASLTIERRSFDQEEIQKSFQELYYKTQRLALALMEDGETHHGLIQARVLEFCNSDKEAAVVATIQTGYWPDWLKNLPEMLEERLAIHCGEVAQLEGFGTGSFGGWFYDNEERKMTGEDK